MTISVPLAAIQMFCTAAYGGIVVFEPNNQFVSLGETVRMTLTLQATDAVTTISGADVVIGSNDVPFTFEYSAEWLAAMPNRTPPIITLGGDFLVGGSNPATGAGRSIVLGTVTVPTGGLTFDFHEIFVNTDIDGFSGIFRGLPSQPFVSEPLSGQGRFYIPEPATILVLAAGVAGLCLRRRRSISRCGSWS